MGQGIWISFLNWQNSNGLLERSIDDVRLERMTGSENPGSAILVENQGVLGLASNKYSWIWLFVGR